MVSRGLSFRQVPAWLAGVWALVCLLALSGPAAGANPGYLDLKVGFAGVQMSTDVMASPGPTAGQVTLQWTAPLYTGSNPWLSYDIRVSSTSNITTNADFNAAKPLSTFSLSTPPTWIPNTRQVFVSTGMVPGTLYCFAIRGVDSGAPPAKGGWLRSPAKGFNVNNCAVAMASRLAQAPFGVDVTTSVLGVTVKWLPVKNYADLGPMPNPVTANDLSGYMVYRATSPIDAPWSLGAGAVLSSTTLSWTDMDLANGPYYYGVQSINTSGPSQMSMLRSLTDWSAWVMGPDKASSIHIPVSALPPVMPAVPGDPSTAYLIQTSSGTADPNNHVLMSMTFTPLKGGVTPLPVALDGMATLTVNYSSVESSMSVSGLRAKDVGAPASSPQDLSVFWWNGTQWLQLYGHNDIVNQVMTIQTKNLGTFQVRTAARSDSFSFDSSGLLNRFITPNGDSKNDAAIFTYNPGPGNIVPTIKIFDVRGRFVTSALTPCSWTTNCLMWDGTAGGKAVPSGVYIYQIQGDGKTYTGTIFVIK